MGFSFYIQIRDFFFLLSGGVVWYQFGCCCSNMVSAFLLVYLIQLYLAVLAGSKKS